VEIAPLRQSDLARDRALMMLESAARDDARTPDALAVGPQGFRSRSTGARWRSCPRSRSRPKAAGALDLLEALAARRKPSKRVRLDVSAPG